MLLCQLKRKVSKAWGFAQVNTTQKTSIVQLNGVSLWWMALVVLALKTVLLPARILGDSMWNWVWCCDTLHRQRLGRYPLSHRSACRQGAQNIQPKTDVLHDFWLPLLFLSFLENNVGTDHGWLEEPPAKVSPPLHRGTTHRVVGMVLIHQINAPPPPHVGVVGNDGLRNGDIFCPPLGPSGWQSLLQHQRWLRAQQQLSCLAILLPQGSHLGKSVLHLSSSSSSVLRADLLVSLLCSHEWWSRSTSSFPVGQLQVLKNWKNCQNTSGDLYPGSMRPFCWWHSVQLHLSLALWCVPRTHPIPACTQSWDQQHTKPLSPKGLVFLWYTVWNSTCHWIWSWPRQLKFLGQDCSGRGSFLWQGPAMV